MLGTNLQNQSDFLIERKQREAPSNQPSGRPLALSIRAEQVIVEPKPTAVLGCTTIHIGQRSNCRTYLEKETSKSIAT
jgi:hypothetical protein